MSSTSDARVRPTSPPAARTADHDATPAISVRNLTMAYGEYVVLREVSFDVQRGQVFVIMGGSGCGKSTLLRNLLGLEEPVTGDILYSGRSFTRASAPERTAMLRQCGVLYQNGALWSSMTLLENVGLPLAQFTDLAPEEIDQVARLKLAMVGLKGFENAYPSEISGGMQKRAGVARAIALDPQVLFFDEPSAGLDPITSSLIDDLILELRANLGTTVVVVTHELASIFAIADDAIFLDGETRRLTAQGNPHELLAHCSDRRVRRFLTRGREDSAAAETR
jgi:phospholipid/cholesterol/gamma-HCH transport system ATP-binding protein